MSSSNFPVNKFGPKIPFDSAAMQDLPSWRENLIWPTTPPLVASDVRHGLAGYMELISITQRHEIRRLLLIAGSLIVVRLWQMQDYARTLQQGIAAGIDFVSSHPDFSYFRDGGVFPAYEAARFVPARPNVPRHPMVRKLINVASWTPICRVPATIFSPTAIAFSSNSEMLVEQVGQSGERVSFCAPGQYLNQARALQADHSELEGDICDEEINDLAARIIACFTASAKLEGIYHERFCEASHAEVTMILRVVMADLVRLQKVDLPKLAWTASSKYESRIVTHEVIRRGGDVVKFDHGGSSGMNGWPEMDAIESLNGATLFFMATNSVADIARKTSPERLIEPVHRTEIVGATAGFPHLRRISRLKSDNRTSRRRRVMYTSSFSRAHSFNPGETMGEPVYRDICLRVSETLAALPVDFVVKPHPQSVSPDGRHYAEAVARVSYEKFEDVMDDVDVFVFDVINSTTFWEAVCTSRSVVFMDLGTTSIDQNILPLLRRRCQVLEAEYDDAGRSQIDMKALEDAVMTESLIADPSEFRHLLADEN